MGCTVLLQGEEAHPRFQVGIRELYSPHTCLLVNTIFMNEGTTKMGTHITYCTILYVHCVSMHCAKTRMQQAFSASATTHCASMATLSLQGVVGSSIVMI